MSTRGAGQGDVHGRVPPERVRAIRLAIGRYRRPLAALAVGVAVAGGVRTLAPPPVATEAVTVAARDLPAGHAVGPGDVTTARWPAGSAPAGVIDPAGRVLGAAVRSGEVFTDARVLGPGMLAGQPADVVAVPVRPADPPAAAQVSPGDRVDVLAGAAADAFGSGGTEAEPLAVAAVVLAAPGPPAGSDGGAGGALDGLTGATPAGDDAAGLLWLGVDAATAARLAGAQGSRPLSIAVRAGHAAVTTCSHATTLPSGDPSTWEDLP